MRSLRSHMILESLDLDNLEYKVEKWFERHPEQKTQWDAIISQARERKGLLSKEAFTEYYSSFDCVKQFVDFMTDNVFNGIEDNNNVNDYQDVFNQIIKFISTCVH